MPFLQRGFWLIMYIKLSMAPESVILRGFFELDKASESRIE